MSRLFIIAILMVCCALDGVAQPQLEIAERYHSFGQIKRRGGEVKHRFVGVNSGDKPLVIVDASVNCNCTRIKHSIRPVKPSDTTYIDVTFAPRTQPLGPFRKAIQLKSNIDGGRTIITVEGEIIE